MFDEPMDRPEAAAGDGTGPLGDLVLDVACGEDGLEGKGVPTFVEAALDSALAFLEPAGENGTHLKSSLVSGDWEAATSSNTGKRRRISSFSNHFAVGVGYPRLFQG
jgi:hypothetical protein